MWLLTIENDQGGYDTFPSAELAQIAFTNHNPLAVSFIRLEPDGKFHFYILEDEA